VLSTIPKSDGGHLFPFFFSYNKYEDSTHFGRHALVWYDGWL